MDFKTVPVLRIIVHRWCCCFCCRFHNGRDEKRWQLYVQKRLFVVCAALLGSSQLFSSFLFFVGLSFLVPVVFRCFVASCNGCAESCLVDIVVRRIFFFFNLNICFCESAANCRDTVWSAFFFLNDTTEWGKKSELRAWKEEVSSIKPRWRKKKTTFFLTPLLLSLLSCFFLLEAWCEKLCEQTSSLHSLASLTQAVVCTDRCTVSLVLCLLMNFVLRVCYGLLSVVRGIGCSWDCCRLHALRGMLSSRLCRPHTLLWGFFFFCLVSGAPFYLFFFFPWCVWVSVCACQFVWCEHSMKLNNVTEDNVTPICHFERIRHT